MYTISKDKYNREWIDKMSLKAEHEMRVEMTVIVEVRGIIYTKNSLEGCEDVEK